MGNPVVTEITQEADTTQFAALDSPQEPEVTEGSDDNAVAEVKPEQIETSDVDQTQQAIESEAAQFRQLLRAQKMELDLLRSTVARHELVQNSDVGEDIPLSDVEQLQADIADLGETRAGELTQLLEVMELNPKYEDVKVVCSRRNFDDILEMAAVDVAQSKGISETTAALLLEREVWANANPYKYMYDLVKGYHPKYQGRVQEEAAVVTKRKVAADAPVSVSGIAGGDAGITSGWTSSKIDALAETDLGKVPPDVYEKYLQGTLA